MDTLTKQYYVTIEVEKFKEILLHSWELLSVEQQRELRKIGVHPR